MALSLPPLALLLAMLYLFATWGGELVGRAGVPADALGKLDLERVAFRADEIAVQVVNSGPVEMEVAQVLVNDAPWTFSLLPDGAIPRLGRATVSIPYLWLEGELHEVKLVTSNGLVFTRAVALAAPTPEPEPASS